MLQRILHIPSKNQRILHIVSLSPLYFEKMESEHPYVSWIQGRNLLRIYSIYNITLSLDVQLISNNLRVQKIYQFLR